MCGINGFNWLDCGMITTMNSTIKHRGPDDEGLHVDEFVSLGHLRLNIIDLSSKGHQPMTNEDGSLWLVYNGEIYNYKDLRSELISKGHKFVSETDSEVALHAYEEWGQECLSKFNGMFAFALYDTLKKIIFLARDRFGVKPLYYYSNNDKFIFSSEIKGILCHPISKRPNENAIFDLLFYNLNQHLSQTYFEGIHKIPHGHYLIYDLTEHTIAITQWYQLPSNEIIPTLEENDVRLQVFEMLQDSVRLRMAADIPVGSCLSGGLDSSSIVCLMRKLMPQGDICTFSAVFPGNRIDESRYIKAVTKHTHTKSYTVSPGVTELGNDLLDLVRTQEEPFPGLSIYAQYHVMKLAHEEGAKVLLDGQGSDELFGGYPYFYGYYFYELLKSMQIGRLTLEAYKSIIYGLLPFGMLGFLLLPNWPRKILWKQMHPMINREFIRSDSRDERIEPRWQPKTLQQALKMTLNTTSIPHLLLYEDKNSMRWSIETRLPFLDYRLVELALSLPSEDKLNKGTTKYLLRGAVQDVLPEQVRVRKDKIGFEVPANQWFSDFRLKAIVRDTLLTDNLRIRPYVNVQYLQKFCSQYIQEDKGTFGKANILWKLLSIELWLREYC